LRLDARCEQTAGADPGTVGLLLQVAAEHLSFQRQDGKMTSRVSIVIADRTASGQYTARHDTATVDWPLEKTNQIATAGVRYRKNFKRASEAVSIRVIVRDQHTGRFGTLDVPVGQILPSQAN
jgi:hypothetical protein